MNQDSALRAQDLAARLKATPHDRRLWQALLEELMRQDSPQPALSLLTTRQTLAADTPSFAYDTFSNLVAGGKGDLVERFLPALAAPHLLWPIALAAAGFIATQRDWSEEAVTFFRRAVSAVPAVRGEAALDPGFVSRVYPHLVNLSEQLEPAAFLDTLGGEPAVPRIAIDPAAETRPYVVAVACDSRYLAAFATAQAVFFAEGPAAEALLHIHVVAPDAAAEALLAELRARHPWLATSRQAGGIVGRPSIYFACSRFLAAPQLIGHYRTPLVLTDVDVVFRRPLAPVLAVLRDHELAFFERDNPAPSLRCSAGLMVLDGGRESLEFLRLYGRYLEAKMTKDSLWMLDQAALWSVTRGLARRGGGPRIGNLTKLLGIEQEAQIEALLPETDKLQLRRASDEA